MQLRYNYRLYPAPGQRQALARAFGCARGGFNDALAARPEGHAAGQPDLTHGELSARLTAAKASPQRAWLCEVSAVVLQQALADLTAAYRNFFASAAGTRKGPRAGPPRFRSRKGGRGALRFPRTARSAVTAGGKLRLPKIGDVPVRWSRELPAGPSSVTVIKDAAGRYFASFAVQAAAGPLPPSGTETGTDLGLTHFAVLSDGRKVANPRFLRRAERRLRTAQQALSRKAPDSSNRDKARIKGRPGPRPGGGRAPRLAAQGIHPYHPRQPSGIRGGLVRGRARPDPAGQVGARRRLVGVRAHAGIQGRQARAHVRPDRPVRAHQPAVLGLRGQRWSQAAGRPHLAPRGVRHGARPRPERGQEHPRPGTQGEAKRLRRRRKTRAYPGGCQRNRNPPGCRVSGTAGIPAPSGRGGRQGSISSVPSGPGARR